MNFKHFVKIEKAYEEDGSYYVQGVASGTLEDRDGERVNKSILESFVQKLPLPLTHNHPKNGDIDGEIGDVIEATIMDNANSDMFVKAKLDMEHPLSSLLVKQINKGKKIGFSIEGKRPMVKSVYSDKLGRNVNEYVSCEPVGISVTTQPSYIPSFVEVLAKSVAHQDNEIIESLNITQNNMDTKEAETVETTETETTVTTKVDVETVETQPSKALEEVKTEETKTEEVKEEVKVEKSASEADVKELNAKVDEVMTLLKSVVESQDKLMKSTETVDELKKSVETQSELVKSLPMARKSFIAKTAEVKPAAKTPENFKEALLQTPILN